MREVFERVVDAEVVEGTAESIPLDDGIADAVTAAQAFHWFDPVRALPELNRVLRPRGGVAIGIAEPGARVKIYPWLYQSAARCATR